MTRKKKMVWTDMQTYLVSVTPTTHSYGLYHFVQPETLPVSMPIGFISTDKETVAKVGSLITDYLEGSSAFDKPNDCGAIASIARGR